MAIRTGRIGEKGTDITVKGNKNHVLAPTWDLVMGLKNGKITWIQYEELYLKLLNERMITRFNEFKKLLQEARESDLVLLCYCKDERFCHRRLAKEFLEKLI